MIGSREIEINSKTYLSLTFINPLTQEVLGIFSQEVNVFLGPLLNLKRQMTHKEVPSSWLQTTISVLSFFLIQTTIVALRSRTVQEAEAPLHLKSVEGLPHHRQ